MKEKKYLKTKNHSEFALSKEFRSEYLDIKESKEWLNKPILVTNLLFQILVDLKDNMFHTNDSYLYVPADKIENQTKLDLWQTDFVNSSENHIAKRYKTSYFLKNRDKKQMIKALDFLKNHKAGFYTFTNNKGKKITTSGGLIQNWFFEDNTGIFEIQISLYWANKIVTLNKGYWMNLKLNTILTYKDVKKRFFVLWLMSLKKYTPILKDVSAILNDFDLNYKTIYDLKRSFIQPIKDNLDNKDLNPNWFSFIFLEDENNSNNLKFITYWIKPKESDLEIHNRLHNAFSDSFVIEPKSKDLVLYRARYYKRRYNLDAENFIIIKDLLTSDYDLIMKKHKIFLKNCRATKKKNHYLSFKNKDFIEEILKIDVK